jgi:hypothetical protein
VLQDTTLRIATCGPLYPRIHYLMLTLFYIYISPLPTISNHILPLACNVQHFRNFVTEVGRRGVNLYGEFQESSPNQTASQLFGHLQPGEKVAITSRYLNDLTLDYVRALEQRGLQGRVISNNQTGLEDFCFLKRAQKEMVGSSMSTFARWAAILGNAQRVQLYVTDAPGMWMKKKRKFSKPISSILLDDNFTWTNPKVLSRIQLPIIPVGADDNVRL